MNVRMLKILFTIFVVLMTIIIGVLIYVSGGDLLIFCLLLVPLIILRFIKAILEIDLYKK